MHNFQPNGKVSGVCVPVSALRTQQSLGWGMFTDLIPLGQWMRKCGLHVIQILPVNDTGYDPSPYMTRSSLALHPIYINIAEILKTENTSADDLYAYKTFAESFVKQTDTFYADILVKKIDFLQQYYQSHLPTEKGPLKKWIKYHPWVIPYTVFCYLKEQHHSESWSKWPNLHTPTEEDIQNFWHAHYTECQFYAWLQYHLDKQLASVVKTLDSLGISLKGDMPIMMDRESVDVWHQRQLFHLDRSAGAPPDQFSDTGQLWGFPCHNWQAHEQNHFAWWKTRLSSLEQYFKYLRLDHIIGFFRIWTIPTEYTSADFGYFEPSIAITEQELLDLGFSKDLIIWLSFPHLPHKEAEEIFSYQLPRVKKYFDVLDNGALLRSKPDFMTDITLWSLDLSEELRKKLIYVSHDRCLLKVNQVYYNLYHYQKSRAYQALSTEQRTSLESLLEKKKAENSVLWEKQARHILGIFTPHTKAVLCAETLGVMPDSLPLVLQDLQILSLNVARWSRYWNRNGQPWISPADYPFLSVATLSVHDSTTLREWWEENDQKSGFLESLMLPKDLAEEPYTVETALAVIHTFLVNTKSHMVILGIQDYLALCEQYRENDPRTERINVPGSIQPLNWHYKLKPTIEELLSDKRFIFLVKVVNTPF